LWQGRQAGQLEEKKESEVEKEKKNLTCGITKVRLMLENYSRFKSTADSTTRISSAFLLV
jgi:hypothetical protein